MYRDERVIAVIPARGGSKGVPKKNLREICGKSLLAWAIECARAAKCVDRIIVSTDDAEIADEGRMHGAEIYLRPAHLATDTALVVDAIRDLMERLRGEGEAGRAWLLLEPSSPLRTKQEIIDCLELLTNKSEGYGTVTTYHEARVNPHRAWKIESGSAQQFLQDSVTGKPRQALPAAYQLNGNVYAFWSNLIDAKTPTIMNGRIGAVHTPKERGFDIDDLIDLEIVSFLKARALSLNQE